MTDLSTVSRKDLEAELDRRSLEEARKESMTPLERLTEHVHGLFCQDDYCPGYARSFSDCPGHLTKYIDAADLVMTAVGDEATAKRVFDCIRSLR